MGSVTFDGLSYATERVAVPGGTVTTYSIGDGPEVLLLVHGGPGMSCDYIRDTHARLAGGRYRVVAYDQLGSGASDRPDDPKLWVIERFVAELEAVRSALGLGKVHVLGQSFGGFVSIDYALAHPEGLKSLILEGSAANIPHLSAEWDRLRLALGSETVAMMQRHEAENTHDHPEYQAAITLLAFRHICRQQEFPPALLRSIGPENQNKAIFRAMQGHDELGPWTGNLRDYDRLDQLGRIAQPVLLLCGLHDAATPAAARLMHERFANSRVKVFQNASHLPFMEEPDEYFRVLKAFLDEQTGAKV